MLTFADTDEESEGEKGPFEELVLLEGMNGQTWHLEEPRDEHLPCVGKVRPRALKGHLKRWVWVRCYENEQVQRHLLQD
jgi:hypothetical protein